MIPNRKHRRGDRSPGSPTRRIALPIVQSEETPPGRNPHLDPVGGGRLHVQPHRVAPKDRAVVYDQLKVAAAIPQCG